MWVLCLFKILPRKKGGGVLMGGWMEDALLRGAVIIPTDEEGRGDVYLVADVYQSVGTYLRIWGK